MLIGLYGEWIILNSLNLLQDSSHSVPDLMISEYIRRYFWRDTNTKLAFVIIKIFSLPT